MKQKTNAVETIERIEATESWPEKVESDIQSRGGAIPGDKRGQNVKGVERPVEWKLPGCSQGVDWAMFLLAALPTSHDHGRTQFLAVVG